MAKKMSKKLRCASASLLVIAANLCLSQGAFAAEVEGAAGDVGDIIVTARRTSERLQDIPLSVTAISQQKLVEAGILTARDLPLLTPGLQTGVSPFDSTNIQFNIRGQSQAGGALESSVGVYIDGVYRQKTFGLAGALFDLDHIEVLKGPQGTLYGKNTSGGAVSITTRKPDLDEVGGFIDVLAGYYQPHSSAAVRTNGAINLPLIQGKLAARISAAYDYSSGYGRDGKGRHLMDKHNPFVRGQLLFEASPTVKILLATDYAKFDSNGLINKIGEANPGAASIAANLELGGGPSPVGPGLALIQTDLRIPSIYDTTAQRQSFDKLEAGGVSLTIDADIADNAHLKSISAFRKLDRKAGNDLDGTQFVILETTTGEENDFYSQELNLSGKLLDGKLDYLGGVFYSRFTAKGGQFPGNGILQVLTASPLHGRKRNVYTHMNTTKSYGIYAHAVYRFSDQFNVTGGLRYSQDKRKFISKDYTLFADGFRSCDFAAYGALLANDCALNFANVGRLPGGPALGPVKDSAVSYEFALTYLPTRDMTLYATTRRGFRAGDWNPSGGVPNKFKPEIATDYEIGLKTTFLDRAVTANIAGYYTKYKDIQKTQVTTPPITEIQNAASAKIKGVEFELNVRPTENFSVGATYTYTDAKYDSFVDATGDYSDEPFDISKNVVTVHGSYTVPLASGDALQFNADIAHFSRRYLTTNSHLLNLTTDPTLVQPGYEIVNARVSYKLNKFDGEIALVARNIANKKYWVNGTQLRALGYIFRNPGEPRFLGVQFVKRLGGG